MEAIANLYLDKRRLKQNNKYPLKLKVYDRVERKKKYYSLNLDFTELHYHKILSGKKIPVEIKDDVSRVRFLLSKAEGVIKSVGEEFTFPLFEKQFFRKNSDANSVIWYFKEEINNKRKNGAIKTAGVYNSSLKYIRLFINSKKLNSLNLNDVTVDFLEEFEMFLLKEYSPDNKKIIKKALSPATVGITMRCIRAIFNIAIEEGQIDRKHYPFGRRKYVAPSKTSRKVSLSNEQLKKLFLSEPKNLHQKKAKDIWFFLYGCNGANLTDIAHLRNDQLDEIGFTFYRIKTERTKKADLKPIRVVFNSYLKEFIKEYRSIKNQKLVFEFISDEDSPEEALKKVDNLNRYIGQHIKRLANDIGLPNKISAQWARHTFGTEAIRNGASMEFMQEAYAHSSINTTKNYFAGFDDKIKREFAQKIFEF